jgi:hypothetical protein
MKTPNGESAGVRFIGARMHRAHFIRRTRHIVSCAEVYELNSTAGVLTLNIPSAPLAQFLIYVCSPSLTIDGGGFLYMCTHANEIVTLAKESTFEQHITASERECVGGGIMPS